MNALAFVAGLSLGSKIRRIVRIKLLLYQYGITNVSTKTILKLIDKEEDDNLVIAGIILTRKRLG